MWQGGYVGVLQGGKEVMSLGEMTLQEKASHTDSHLYRQVIGTSSNRWFSEKTQLVGVQV